MIETDNILSKALSEALETMAFMSTMPSEEESVIPEEPILTEINFMGPKSGTIQMLAGLDFGKTLAENIAALDEVDDEACLDALKELANVTCGLFLPMLASPEADPFDVTIPTVKCRGDLALWDKFTTDLDSCVLNIEGYMIAVKLIMDHLEIDMEKNGEN